MKPGNLIRRRLISKSNINIFLENEIQDQDKWVALVISITPPDENNTYYVLEAVVSQEERVMKSWLTHEELGTLIEVIQ